MAHQTTWEKDGIYCKYYNTVTLREIRNADNEIYKDSRFDDLKYFICDATEVRRFDMENNDIDIPAALDTASSSYKPELKGALVSDNESIRKHLNRYIDTSKKLGSTWQLQLFSRLEEARKWVSS